MARHLVSAGDAGDVAALLGAEAAMRSPLDSSENPAKRHRNCTHEEGPRQPASSSLKEASETSWEAKEWGHEGRLLAAASWRNGADALRPPLPHSTRQPRKQPAQTSTKAGKWTDPKHSGAGGNRSGIENSPATDPESTSPSPFRSVLPAKADHRQRSSNADDVKDSAALPNGKQEADPLWSSVGNGHAEHSMMPASPHVGAAVKPVNGTQEAEPLFDANPTHQKKQATQHHSTEVVAQPPADSFAKKAAQKGTFMREREGSARTAPSKRTSLRDEAAEEMASATPNGDQEAQKTSVNPFSGQHPQNVSPHPTSDERQMQEKVQRWLDLLCIDGLRRSEDKEERLRTLLYELRHTKLPRRVMELMLTVAYTLDGELAQSSSGPSEAKKSAYALLLHRVKQQEDSEKQRTLQKEFDKRCSELIFLNTRIGELDDSDDESNDAELLDAIDMILFWFQWRRMEEGCHSVPNGKCASFIIGVCALMTDYAVAFENGREDLRYAGKLSRVLELAQASQSQCDYLVRRGAEEIDLATCSQRREGGGGTDLPEVATSADGENGAEQACAGTTIRSVASF
eukprot:scaffold11_cov257-Pinguiococcus_pyrenoidosus.AAC.44